MAIVTTISDLPATCVEKIFFQLSLRDRLRCSRVCQRWAEVLIFADLRHLNIFDLPLVKQPLVVGSLNGRSLAPHSVILDALNSVLPRTSAKLKSISFHSNKWWWEATYDQLQLITRLCPQLDTLKLTNCDFKLVCEAHLVQLIKQLSNLRSFALFYSDLAYSNHFAKLLGKNSFAREFFSLSWPLLERLEMSTDVAFPAGFYDFDTAISQLTQLRYLSLDTKRFCVKAFIVEKMDKIFRSCLQLTDLKLHCNHNQFWPQLNQIANLPCLERLEIRGKFLRDANLLSVGRMAQLKEICIEGGQDVTVTNVGVTNLLENCPQLATFHLLKPQITAKIFEVIGECPNLRLFHACPIYIDITAGLQLLLTKRLADGSDTQPLAIHTNLSCDGVELLQRLQLANVTYDDCCYHQPH